MNAYPRHILVNGAPYIAQNHQQHSALTGKTYNENAELVEEVTSPDPVVDPAPETIIPPGSVAPEEVASEEDPLGFEKD